jgi:hypothetical protein
LSRELFTDSQGYGVLVDFGKAAVYNRHQPLRGWLGSHLPMGRNHGECLGYEIWQGVRIKRKDQQDQPGAIDCRKQSGLTVLTTYGGPEC